MFCDINRWNDPITPNQEQYRDDLFFFLLNTELFSRPREIGYTLVRDVTEGICVVVHIIVEERTKQQNGPDVCLPQVVTKLNGSYLSVLIIVL